MAFKALKRLRHSHGFGVHSPYGYRFVQSVISPSRQYAYYAEEYFEGLLAKERHRHRIEKEARTLLRLSAFINPASAFMSGDAHKAFSFALRSVNSRILLTDKTSDIANCDLVATSGDLIPLEDLCAYISEPGRTLVGKDLPSGWGGRLFGAMQEGVCFEGKKNSIFISKPSVRKVRYLMNI
ncbi:MAG: hypothetical protein K2K97_12280 [Muribaculaceae bacterium]|nr:hypothetical protein [Muribaculaceae bacterium]